MIAIITGDLKGSKEVDAEQWVPNLQKAIEMVCPQPENREIYRGDSFQIKLQPAESLKAAFMIKAFMLKQNNLEVRMAIGIGEEDYAGSTIKTSNGSAYIRSGEAFDNLKKKLLAIRSHQPELDEAINIMLDLSGLTISRWSVTTAETMLEKWLNDDKNQLFLAERLNKTQASISEALKRGGYDELREVIDYFHKKNG